VIRGEVSSIGIVKRCAVRYRFCKIGINGIERKKKY